jgi:glycosyltransferase involved in cell wall biosynthesis
MMEPQPMKVAIVHDYLTQSGGAERVVEAFHEIWPDAPIFTSVYDANHTFKSFRQMDVRTSFLQKLPLAGTNRHHKKFLTLFPMAFEMLDLREYDLVISSTSSFAKGIITYPHTCHVTYCHTPSRFAWRYREYVDEGGFGKLERLLMPWVIHRLRAWDYLAAQRPDFYICNSDNVASRVEKFYRRSSVVVFPPVNTNRIQIVEKPTLDYWLCVSRFLGYKRVDLAVQAATKLGVRLKVVGSGPDEARLKAIAGPTVEFLGRVPDGEVEGLFGNCIGFLFPGEEDFGIAPIEAMAAGRPVVAYRAGGAIETVVEGVTGVFFDEPSVDSVAAAMQSVSKMDINPQRIRAHAETFGYDRFRLEMKTVIEQCLHDYRFRRQPSKMRS